MTEPTSVVKYSFVIPTYNRAELVLSSVHSALEWLGPHQDGEIIVVDNASQDGSVERLKSEFSAELARGTLQIIVHHQNSGVIRSKNDGGHAARGRWLIYLDSDDLINPSQATTMRAQLDLLEDSPIVFFRCEDIKTGKLIGEGQIAPARMELSQYLNESIYSECLPVVRRDVFGRFPYDESLDGWEGITYARILRDVGPLTVSPIVARRYRTDGDDRLTSRRGLKKRARSMARGHWVLLLEFWGVLTPRRRLSQGAKILYYYAWALS